MSTAQEALSAAYQSWNAGDLNGYLSLYDEGIALHMDAFTGVPATGADIALPGITILHFRGDRVVERFSQADMLGLLVQVGAVPALA